jgi:hypothetical protein
VVKVWAHNRAMIFSSVTSSRSRIGKRPVTHPPVILFTERKDHQNPQDQRGREFSRKLHDYGRRSSAKSQ